MIKNNLRVLMAIKKMRIVELARISNVDYRTISNLYNEKSKGIEFETLDKICNALQCSASEIFEHIPEE